MAAVVTLIDATPTTHLSVKGVVLDRTTIELRQAQRKISKFWGLDGESHIFGGKGGRGIAVRVLVYDVTDFDTPRKITDYLTGTLNGTAVGKQGTLTITSAADYAPFADVTYDGFQLIMGPLKDDAGTLGGQWWVDGFLLFRQLS